MRVLNKMFEYEDGSIVLETLEVKYKFASITHFEAATSANGCLMRYAALVFDKRTGKYLKHREIGCGLANEILAFAGVTE